MYSRKKLADAIRILSIDSVQKAQSGHPGMPMGMADIAEVLWRDFLKHNPSNPSWSNRDRFVLSNGHGSMLLYSLLHLTGYDLSLEELKNFRQLNSRTPGHPEIGHTPGVEITTGPLGQGLATAVGMAIAERTLGATFNRPGYDIVDHYTWVFVGDGCLMEGISHEVCSLAGTFKLGKLVVFYDSNGISIDGNIVNWFTDDTDKRFSSYNWHVVSNVDGHDSNSISNAIKESILVKDKPSLIICKTIIGFGSPNKSGKEDAHGSPLGELEVRLTKKNLDWDHPSFIIPQEIYENWNFLVQGKLLEDDWNKKFIDYERQYPRLAGEYIRRINRIMPSIWKEDYNEFINDLCLNPKNIATRTASQHVLEFFSKHFSEIIGGSSDLSPSNLSMWSGSRSIKDDLSGNYIHYGVREFGMTAIANGLFHHGGFIPYTSTFLIFTDYARNAVRMAALMKTQHIFIYTHDSIGLGEDGPTHQPIEQLATLRLTPNTCVWRPCDQIETLVAWKSALENKFGPTALVLSRQNLLQISRNKTQVNNISRGGYILRNSSSSDHIDAIIISTGSEVSISLSVYNTLVKKGYCIRIVSMPSTNVFDQQDDNYKESVLPKLIKNRVAIEAGISDFWYKYVGLDGIIIGMNSFGGSAPSDKLFKKFGFSVDDIVQRIVNLLTV
ncbi:transketolase [Buchnera aphidicola]|uniref:Transketolase n=1 Tax=Buchnera aphidicola subsp. Melaphis rhois TaxID=118103 RepID=A0A4D6Y269_BUCMH|nr:transketolase [Buchnera aphidicola]QCI23127.1 transketolase [Buchnera aphidicola (Melaphis rhois)]